MTIVSQALRSPRLGIGPSSRLTLPPPGEAMPYTAPHGYMMRSLGAIRTGACTQECAAVAPWWEGLMGQRGCSAPTRRTAVLRRPGAAWIWCRAAAVVCASTRRPLVEPQRGMTRADRRQCAVAAVLRDHQRAQSSVRNRSDQGDRRCTCRRGACREQPGGRC